MADYEVQYTLTLSCTTDNGGKGHPADEIIARLIGDAASWFASAGVDVQDVSAVLEYDGESDASDD